MTRILGHLLFFAALFHSGAVARELYVSPSGNDSNPGTKDKPFATTIKARTFQDGVPIGFTETATFEKVERVQRPSWLETLVRGRWVGPNAEASEPAKTVWLGATLVSLADDPDLIDASGGWNAGAFLEDVPTDSRAYRLGLRPSDIVQNIAGRLVRDIEALKKIVSEGLPNSVEVQFVRNYDRMTIRIEE